ncbi:MAG: ChaN family lipoprotein, partial [Paracoccaceae bacterium]
MRILVLLLGLLGAAPWAWGAQISGDVLDAVPRADVVVLGEVHDNPEHHMNQARAVFSLSPKAVVWEMLSADAAGRVPSDIGNPARVAQALG